MTDPLPGRCNFLTGQVLLSYAFSNDDHGKTWQYGASLEVNTSDECEVVELTDGMIDMNVRSRRHQKERTIAVSRDGGQRGWLVTFDDRLPQPSCHGEIVHMTDRSRS